MPLWLFPLVLLPLGAVLHLLGPGAALVLLCWQFIFSAIAFCLTMIDKHRAQQKAWRIPEAHLHLLEALGGWPGAIASQRLFRHKTKKRSYQLILWGIVSLWQIAALDALCHGPIHQQIGPWLEKFTR